MPDPTTSGPGSSAPYSKTEPAGIATTREPSRTRALAASLRLPRKSTTVPAQTSASAIEGL